jgi:hypothetical protein
LTLYCHYLSKNHNDRDKVFYNDASLLSTCFEHSNLISNSRNFDKVSTFIFKVQLKGSWEISPHPSHTLPT